MSLGLTPLDPASEQEVRRLVALIPDAELKALAATEPLFKTGGFRGSHPGAVRTRTEQLALGGQETPEPIRRLLARRSRSHSLLRLLSPEAIAQHRHAWAALLSPPAFLVSLLLDPRPEVREHAADWASAPAVLPEPAAALAQLREAFADLNDLLGSPAADAPAADAPPPSRELWRAQKERLDLRIRDLQEENRRLKGADDRLANAHRRLQEAEEQLAESRRRQAEAETASRQNSRACEEATRELARETAQRESRVAAAVDLALAQEFHGWLARARAAEAAAADPAPQAELLERAEEALRQQAALDRHSGNLATLADRLATLTDAHRRVSVALRQALNPSPRLRAIENELAEEIRRLSALLDPDPPETPLEAALLARIHTSDDAELPRLRSLPDLVASLRVLDDPALGRVREAFHRRLAALQATGTPPDPDTEARQNAVSLLGRALAGQTPAILLVDGHNVIFGLPARYSPPRGGALNDAAKRKRLTDDLVRLTAPNPAVRAWLVFDGPTRHDTQAAPNVRVTYSGGSGEHRADSVLLDNIRFFQSAAPELAVLLVSNDNALCGAARRLGAQTVPVLDLGAFL